MYQLSAGLIGTVWLFTGIMECHQRSADGAAQRQHARGSGGASTYIAFASLPMVIFFVLVWVPPVEVDTWLLVAYFIVVVFAFDALWTLVVIADGALPEMVSNLDERAGISAGGRCSASWG